MHVGLYVYRNLAFSIHVDQHVHGLGRAAGQALADSSRALSAA